MTKQWMLSCLILLGVVAGCDASMTLATNHENMMSDSDEPGPDYCNHFSDSFDSTACFLGGGQPGGGLGGEGGGPSDSGNNSDACRDCLARCMSPVWNCINRRCDGKRGQDYDTCAERCRIDNPVDRQCFDNCGRGPCWP